MVVRAIGVALLAAGLGIAIFDIVLWMVAGVLDPTTLGGMWFAIHKASLNVTQAVIQRYIAAWLWDPIIQWVLLQPAAAVLGLPGALLTWIGWPRRNQRPTFRRESGSFRR